MIHYTPTRFNVERTLDKRPVGYTDKSTETNERKIADPNKAWLNFFSNLHKNK